MVTAGEPFHGTGLALFRRLAGDDGFEVCFGNVEGLRERVQMVSGSGGAKGWEGLQKGR